jgi:hypothetical protein
MSRQLNIAQDYSLSLELCLANFRILTNSLETISGTFVLMRQSDSHLMGYNNSVSIAVLMLTES